MKKASGILLGLFMAMACMAGCTAGQMGYSQISQEEAKEIMEKEEDYLILDVRRIDEYEAGHIPGAINLPNEEISVGEIGTGENGKGEMTEAVSKVLPNKDQIILVYCRSGNRSKQASDKLALLGYTKVYEFGGINTWTGEVVTGKDPYPEGEGERKGGTMDSKKEEGMELMIGEETVPVTWEENPSVEELKALAGEDGLTIPMSMYSDFEQVGSLGADLTREDEQTTTEPGDIVLYAGNQLVIFYGSNAWAYTRLGHVDLPAERMKELLGGGNVTVNLR